jgi:hypothetical protein
MMLRQQRSPPAAVAFVLLLTLTGCYLFEKIAQSWEDMTPKEKATWLMAAYNREYDRYLAQAANPAGLSEDMKTVLRAKKQAMIVAWPLVRAYVEMVDQGVVSVQTEEAALKAIEALLGIGHGGLMAVTGGGDNG